MCLVFYAVDVNGLPWWLSAQSLFKLMSIESMMPSNHPILCHPLLLLPSIFSHQKKENTKSEVLIAIFKTVPPP